MRAWNEGGVAAEHGAEPRSAGADSCYCTLTVKTSNAPPEAVCGFEAR